MKYEQKKEEVLLVWLRAQANAVEMSYAMGLSLTSMNSKKEPRIANFLNYG
jgi:hypothetical protein